MMKKKGRNKGYILRSVARHRREEGKGKRKREMVEEGGGCATEGYARRARGRAREQGSKGTKGRKGADSLVTPAGNDQRREGDSLR